MDGSGAPLFQFESKLGSPLQHSFQLPSAMNHYTAVDIQDAYSEQDMGGTKTSSGMTSGVFARRVLRLSKNWINARRGDNSYAGEIEHLQSLLKKLNITGGFLVDIAASDGVNQSCTLGFLSSGGWEGLAVEMDPEKFANLAFIFSQFADVKLARNKVTPENVEAVLVSNAVPRDFTLLNLDIDSYDLTVMEEMLNAEFRPAVISMEVNEKIPPPVYFRVNFDDSHFWKGDDFFGCSLAAAASVMKPRGEQAGILQFNNARSSSVRTLRRESLAIGPPRKHTIRAIAGKLTGKGYSPGTPMWNALSSLPRKRMFASSASYSRTTRGNSR